MQRSFYLIRYRLVIVVKLNQLLSPLTDLVDVDIRLSGPMRRSRTKARQMSVPVIQEICDSIFEQIQTNGYPSRSTNGPEIPGIPSAVRELVSASISASTASRLFINRFTCSRIIKGTPILIVL
mmetsp:Transcript_16675/g.68283  ORF Transcript_16675/g.68283 Transcript_16675/m.68283 type:complete len:124 (-) Transcript_16675:72-443(-)